VLSEAETRLGTLILSLVAQSVCCGAITGSADKAVCSCVELVELCAF